MLRLDPPGRAVALAAEVAGSASSSSTPGSARKTSGALSSAIGAHFGSRRTHDQHAPLGEAFFSTQPNVPSTSFTLTQPSTGTITSSGVSCPRM